MRKWDLDGSGFQAPQTVSARGSGLPLFAGLIRPKELQAGLINHALAISVPGPAQSVFVQPASSTDGNGRINSLPEGARIRLKANVEVPRPTDPKTGKAIRMTPQQRRMSDAIVAALRTYGAIVVDRAAVPTLYAQRDVTSDMIARQRARRAAPRGLRGGRARSEAPLHPRRHGHAQCLAQCVVQPLTVGLGQHEGQLMATHRRIGRPALLALALSGALLLTACSQSDEPDASDLVADAQAQDYAAQQAAQTAINKANKALPERPAGKLDIDGTTTFTLTQDEVARLRRHRLVDRRSTSATTPRTRRSRSCAPARSTSSTPSARSRAASGRPARRSVSTWCSSRSPPTASSSRSSPSPTWAATASAPTRSGRSGGPARRSPTGASWVSTTSRWRSAARRRRASRSASPSSATPCWAHPRRARPTSAPTTSATTGSTRPASSSPAAPSKAKLAQTYPDRARQLGLRKSELVTARQVLRRRPERAADREGRARQGHPRQAQRGRPGEGRGPGAGGRGRGDQGARRRQDGPRQVRPGQAPGRRRPPTPVAPSSAASAT